MFLTYVVAVTCCDSLFAAVEPGSGDASSVEGILLTQAAEAGAKVDREPTAPQKPAETTTTDELQYVRIRRDSKNLAQALETPVITMKGSRKFPSAQVDLIGAIHLGEPEYYTRLNQLFKSYDVLLYEAVMPEEAVRQGFRPGGARGAGRPELSDEEEWNETKIGLAAISVLQLGMKDALGLQFQLAGVDYSESNFVHADMTSEEFEESMRRRGESFSEMLAKEMSKAIVTQQEQNPIATNLDLMLSALSSDRFFRIRRIVAVQLAKMDEAEAFSGPDGTSTIITERNIKAVKVLDRELKRKRRKIGIFYGAAHLADMEKRIQTELGFERSGETWLTAWNLRRNSEATSKKSEQNEKAGSPNSGRAVPGRK
ncbi:MAG: hypothetical protein ACK526_01265 [Planctomyces sp.]